MDNRNKTLSVSFYTDSEGHLTSTGLNKGIYITGVSGGSFSLSYYSTASKHMVDIMAARIVFSVDTKIIFGQ